MPALLACRAAAATIGPSSAEERHELLVTYEGPFHPSVRSPPSNISRKTFSVTLPPSGIISPRDRGSPSYVSRGDLLARLSAEVGWPPSLLCIDGYGGSNCDAGERLFPSHSLRNGDASSVAVVHHQHPPLVLAIRPCHTLLLGGKGGFGTLLKGQSKQAGARTTLDFGACRDLSGRRLRHVNDEIKLRKWREMQARRERAAETGEKVDELEALKTPSGIRNWHLMVPSWSEGAAFSNKGRRKIERQLQREVRGWQSKEERARRAREERRSEEEWAVMEYVRRGEEEGRRAAERDVKEGILAHMRKRKQERTASAEAGKKDASFAAGGCEKSSLLIQTPDESTSATSHLMTLSGEMSVFNITDNKMTTSVNDRPARLKPIRIQSQSDFATVVILLNVSKMEESSGGAKKRGVYLEHTLRTAGLAQVGWIRTPAVGGDANDGAAATFLPNSDTGDGVGDDAASFGYDGSRGLKFHDGKEVAYGRVENGGEKRPAEWKAGDVLGCWCRYADADDGKGAAIEIGYALNGVELGAAFAPQAEGGPFGYYPALSLNLNEVVDVNVGPDFAFDVKDGCAGACELVSAGEAENGSEEHASEPDGESSKPEDGEGGAKDRGEVPPWKRPREETVAVQGDASDGKDETAKEGKNADSASNPAASAVETFELNKCSSIDELKEMGSDRLKNILLSMGVKCGGTPEERAKRLFSLKGLRRDEYPKKVRGKNFIS